MARKKRGRKKRARARSNSTTPPPGRGARARKGGTSSAATATSTTAAAPTTPPPERDEPAGPFGRASGWMAVAMMVAAGWFIVPEFLPLFEQRTPGGTETTAVAEGFEPGPDLQVQKIDISSLDEAGRLHWRLLADDLEQATPEDESLLTRPELRLRTAREDANWKFVADGGKVSPDGDTVYLPGQVSGELDTTPSLEFRSSDVEIKIAGGYGETAAPTMVRRGGFVTRGEGAKFWLDEGRVEFLSEVETTYEAQPRAPSPPTPDKPRTE